MTTLLPHVDGSLTHDTSSSFAQASSSGNSNETSTIEQVLSSAHPPYTRRGLQRLESLAKDIKQDAVANGRICRRKHGSTGRVDELSGACRCLALSGPQSYIFSPKQRAVFVVKIEGKTKWVTVMTSGRCSGNVILLRPDGSTRILA